MSKRAETKRKKPIVTLIPPRPSFFVSFHSNHSPFASSSSVRLFFFCSSPTPPSPSPKHATTTTFLSKLRPPLLPLPHPKKQLPLPGPPSSPQLVADLGVAQRAPRAEERPRVGELPVGADGSLSPREVADGELRELGVLCLVVFGFFGFFFWGAFSSPPPLAFLSLPLNERRRKQRKKTKGL